MLLQLCSESYCKAANTNIFYRFAVILNKNAIVILFIIKTLTNFVFFVFQVVVPIPCMLTLKY